MTRNAIKASGSGGSWRNCFYQSWNENGCGTCAYGHLRSHDTGGQLELVGPERLAFQTVEKGLVGAYI